jgi:hypothetical protein
MELHPIQTVRSSRWQISSQHERHGSLLLMDAAIFSTSTLLDLFTPLFLLCSRTLRSKIIRRRVVGVLVLTDLYINCIARLLSLNANAGLERSLAGCSGGWSLVYLPYRTGFSNLAFLTYCDFNILTDMSRNYQRL